MKRILFSLVSAIVFFVPHSSWAEGGIPADWLRTITFYHEIYEYKLPLAKYPEYFQQQPVDVAALPEDDGVCYWGEEQNAVEPAQRSETTWNLNKPELRTFFAEYIIPEVEQAPTDVRIYRDEAGNIAFEGAGNYGKTVDVAQAISLLKTALENGVERIELPVILTEPVITVEDEELRRMGIQEIVSVGESDFTGSSWARMQNIEVGSMQFNGFVIEPGATASFNDRLGPVDGSRGYLPELVIVGPKLEKEYGGGLCQVSSTAFRAALLAGLPIVERYPHSFAVSYYAPFGTDATIYPGHKDLRFENDTAGAILVQTTMDRENKKLRFHFYGTKDDRKVKMFGPEVGRHVGPPPPRNETSTKLAPGEVQWLSHAVAGFDTIWRRVLIPPTVVTEQKTDSAEGNENSKIVYEFFSRYQPRGNWKVTGVAEAEPENPPAPTI